MGCSEIEFKRSVNSLSLTKELIKYSAQSGYVVESGLNASIRGQISGFDTNAAMLPGVFSLNDDKAGLPVSKKYFTRAANNDFVSLTEHEANILEKQGECILLVVEESNGQLGPSDFKCYCIFEQLIYEEVTSNKRKYSDGCEDKYVYLGNIRGFAKKALGYDNDSAYKTVTNFIKRIRGLSFTAKGPEVGFSLKTTGKMIYGDIDYKPFTGHVLVGEVNGNRGINILVNNKYIQNILNGGSRLQYNDIINSIDNPLSKFLFRYLCLRDRKFHLLIKYSTLVQIMDIKRETTLSAASRQIGRIAKRINNKENGEVLIVTNLSGKGFMSENIPFGVKDMKAKDDWQFIFNLNVNVTPEMHTYVRKPKVQIWVMDVYKRWREIMKEIHENAYELGMTPAEYFKHGYGGVYIFNNLGLAENEIEKLRKYFANQARKKSFLGGKAEKVFGGVDAANQALNEIESHKKEVYYAAKEQAATAKVNIQLPTVEVRKRGRGRPKKEIEGLPF